MSTPPQHKSAASSLYPPLAALFKSGRFAQLENQARSVLRQYPDFGPAWKLLGLALRSQRRNDPAVWSQAAELLPDDPEVHYNLGDCYRGLGQPAEAATCYQRVLGLSPNELGAYLNLGMMDAVTRRASRCSAGAQRFRAGK
jgi:tetratricopeptide (TPR) repeat protein